MYKLFLIIISSFLFLTGYSQTRIACLGNYSDHDKNNISYPEKLNNLLGKKYTVKAFGHPYSSLIDSSTTNFIHSTEIKKALVFNPDIVIIDFGITDSKNKNCQLHNYYNAYTEVIKSFKGLASEPRIILLLPRPVFDTCGLYSDQILKDSIIPAIERAAFDENCEIVNLRNMFLDSPNMFSSQLKPKSKAVNLIAKRIKEVILTGNKLEIDIINKSGITVKKSNYHGYECYDFLFEDNPCKIVKPKFSARDNPWIWKARFWTHFPQTELGLLERGYHLVYCDVANLFGNDSAVKRWNNFHNFLVKNGLSKKCALMGLSRGGLIVYNWAVENPEKVACIYVDAPVLDIKSWPGRFYPYGGSSNETWELCKKAYGLKSDEEAKTAKVSPIDKTEKIAKTKIPLLHICGLADSTVPYEYNTKPFAEKIKAAGGKIMVIEKPGVKHHPHSLANPEPILEFILRNNRKK